MNSKCIYDYDENNTQIPYTYMARTIDEDKIAVGFVVIEKPWYSPQDQWRYYIMYNDYGSGGCCGGCSDLGIKRVEIDKDTIVPFNQFAQIKLDQEHGYDVLLENVKNYTTNELLIRDNNDIPTYYLWNGWYNALDDETKRRYALYGAGAKYKGKTTPVKRDIVAEIIARNELKESNNSTKRTEIQDKRLDLYEAICKFWNENKGNYSSMYVIVSEDGYDYEKLYESEEGKYSHSLSCKEFFTFEGCCKDFVEEINPYDVGAFNTGELRGANSEWII